ncbi:ComEC/Rec2 family competence protein [Flaviaesturariibacter aridisoli]|uniref:MBL fold metallo-hydrolase n=1 Tax=Flaviaesturariibacter aridisoli TaxID=2545761 RepID=A0A4R4DYL9_9BACT|nr:hypothetical protein [Flaviaesturariibacter aridisoli]TCZ68386.1 hypothetical protein E0486_13975 [Flaviaesturariibacter aridisoli]
MSQTLEIHHLNVEQGESTLLVIDTDGAKTTILIDGGLQAQGTAIKTYVTDLLGVGTELDYVLISHFDEDHWEGIRWLIQEGSIIGADTRFYSPPVSFDKFLRPVLVDKKLFRIDKFKLLELYLKGSGSRAGSKEAGDIEAFETDRLEVSARLLPLMYKPIDHNPPVFLRDYRSKLKEYNERFGTLLGGALTITTQDLDEALQAGTIFENKAKWVAPVIRVGAVELELLRYGVYDSNHNNDSLAWLLRFHNFRYYTGGDLKTELEDELFYTPDCTDIPPGARPAEKIHVFKAGHHGANGSTSDKFLKMLRPDAGIVSCGNPVIGKNTHKHPRPALMRRLLENNVSTFVTNLITSTNIQLPDAFEKYSWFNVTTGNVKLFNAEEALVSTKPVVFTYTVQKAAWSLIGNESLQLAYTFENEVWHSLSQSPYEVDFLVNREATAMLNKSLIHVANPIESFLSIASELIKKPKNYFIGESDKFDKMKKNSIRVVVTEMGAQKPSPDYHICCGPHYAFFPRIAYQPARQTLLTDFKFTKTDQPSERKRKRETADTGNNARQPKRLRKRTF